MNSVNLTAILALIIHLHALLTLFLDSGSSSMQVIRRMNLKMRTAIDATELLQLSLAAHNASP